MPPSSHDDRSPGWRLQPPPESADDLTAPIVNDPLHHLLRRSDGGTFRFTFTDGEEMLAEVVSDSHVDADSTLIVMRVGATPTECGWQIHLADVAAVAAEDGGPLYRRL